MIATLTSGFGGYLFGDSLHDRNRAEIRTEILKIYFGISNDTAGKRKQILSFVQMVLAKDDRELKDWASKEETVVDGNLKDIEDQIDAKIRAYCAQRALLASSSAGTPAISTSPSAETNATASAPTLKQPGTRAVIAPADTSATGTAATAATATATGSGSGPFSGSKFGAATPKNIEELLLEIDELKNGATLHPSRD